MGYRVSEEDASLYRETGFWGNETLSALFRENVKRTPEALALCDMPGKEAATGLAERRLSYDALHRAVQGLADQLGNAGLEAGDILLVQLPNSAELAATYLAAWERGIIVSPVPMQWRRHELEGVLEATGAKALMTLARFKEENHEALAHAAAEKASARPQLFVWGAAASKNALPLEWREVEPLPAKTGDPQRLATICWTSGTEARPKGVPRHHDHWRAAGMAMVEACGLGQGDVILCPFPLVNMAALGGTFVPWLLTGGTLVLHHPLDLPVFLKQLVAEKVNYTVAPPAVLNMLLKDEKLLAMLDLSNFRSIGSGSAPLAPFMVKGFQERFGLPIVNIFGSNEGTCLSSGAGDVPEPENRAQFFPRIGGGGLDWPSEISTVTRTKLVDLQSGDEVLEEGVPGELVIKGPTVFDGYWREGSEDGPARAIDAEGFFHTGDVFEIAGDSGRFYRFVERAKDIIIRGGMNISPGEIDGLMAGHPDIAEAAVFGVPDERLGERICAALVPANGKAVTLQSLTDYLRAEGIAAYKLPEMITEVEALPRNPLGKVLRRVLKETYLAKV